MEKLCELCPRRCKVNRKDKLGFCGEKQTMKIAKVMLHKWEEPIISGEKGTGAIFFCGCSLKCIYCQNYEISSGSKYGLEVTPNQLATIFKQLEQDGASSVDLVSPTHFTNQIIKALKIYKPKIPIVWNTSGYETEDTIEKLKGYVDIFLTDFKYFDRKLSAEYSACTDYFDVCLKAIKKMREILPEDVIENGLMKKGIIIRHLILPNGVINSKCVLNTIFENFGNQTYVSLMSQYTPCYKAKNHKILKRKLKKREYESVIKHLISLGFENGFVQELSSSTEEYIPDFENFGNYLKNYKKQIVQDKEKHNQDKLLKNHK